MASQTKSTFFENLHSVKIDLWDLEKYDLFEKFDSFGSYQITGDPCEPHVSNSPVKDL